ncbi:homoserine O-acetyltransferase MetX [Flavihumibacter petaseus]|uniref:Homoserine O-acetyltransferase n=1 Tax=Flavihumibacter petaseus NBRC 106054 TaxID=1220578 RepID=A0A0E9N470_9BACT|nr:homoserine O-acetyltransferase [Flavihumibacter petaseus]GAO44777.1 homoserine O-acetyltransferase [Flavihumibacter petaseus NBRC 106054]
MLHRFVSKTPFSLENGRVLPELEISYHTYGKLNNQGDNVVWVCHALTANADAVAWWPGVVGEQGAIDPERYFIVCANILGSCYGSSGPLSINPETGSPYYAGFPIITIRDQVNAHRLLREELGIQSIALCMGGSMGGYQVLEWALLEPSVIKRIFLIATSATESAWGIAIHESQRLAIEADASWQEPDPAAGSRGLKAARAIGMLTYRNYSLMVQQQQDPDPEKVDGFKAASYIRYQGEKLVSRFNAQAYWILTKSMDSHHIGRGRNMDAVHVLNGMAQPALVMGITSDLLCPPEEQRKLAQSLPQARYVEIDSPYGHDGFLVEAEKVSAALRDWLGK